MIHLRARRLLSALPDGTLPAATEASVRDHAAGCARCQRILADYEAMDRLLRSIPGNLVSASPEEAELSLGAVARWFGPRRIPWFERLPIHPIGAVVTAGALLLSVFLLTPAFETESAEPFNFVVMAAAPPPRADRPRRSGPSLQPTLREHSAESYLLPVAAR